MLDLIDLSHLIESGMPVYPGDEIPQLVQSRYLAEDDHNNHRLQIGMHAGTHLDAPLHMLAHGKAIFDLPLTPFIGPGCLLDVRGQDIIRWHPSYDCLVQPASIVLLYTGHDQWYGSDKYFIEHPCLDQEFCDFLVQKRIKMLGMDLPSPDMPPFSVHKQLLAHNIYLLENLTNLNQLLHWQNYEIIALPLKLRADGSPVRAVARKLS